ncbi:hypothetical protein NUH88_14055 [Nisaea acidiphila]|uniref:Glutamine amidotransferase domain-containing protein n=1 Tax=Nisaea acidiphila TaxID=1862145 RepID=A0A9J7AQ96_9PROT|nr:hypothetical protein [Nisaea acidiphila]UUX48532.1 hypothetical protein NUH88_14055 [Nisaea acidiphila]
MIGSAVGLDFSPMIPWWAIAALGAVGLALVIYTATMRGRGAVWRTLALAVLIAGLANPYLIAEDRDPRNDVAVLLLDESTSQSIDGRSVRASQIAEDLTAQLERFEDLDLRVVSLEGGRARAGSGRDGTRLFAALRDVLDDVPQGRLAGVLAITDGQSHDRVEEMRGRDLGAPLHVILSGRRGERDRRLVVEHVPSFGVVGRSVTAKIRIEDPDAAAGVPLELSIDGVARPDQMVRANQVVEIEIPIEHGGETIVELTAGPGPDELTEKNNRAVLAINGVRDRLRVLLVSGAPHSGERTWRDLLKADPSVDLVHFTILRPPEKQDGTPVRELSLIAFPVRELFELKLDEFDLIIFDQYQRRGVLPRSYLRNIVEFVRGGGAFLEASGPPFASRLSLANTPLGEVLPAMPTGAIVEEPFRAHTTMDGHRHPVTADLPGGPLLDADGIEAEAASWGRWFRQIEADVLRGVVLMDGPEGRPLLVLDRFGEGRVAHLLTDQMWLWTRGFDGGGPQAEVLRRTAHWLMREPDLEENDLRVRVRGEEIEVIRRSLDGELPDVTMTLPDGREIVLPLARTGPGRGQASFTTDQVGLHSFTDGVLTKLAAVGALNPIELSDVRTTDEWLGPLAEQTGGSVTWGAEESVPDLRRVRAGRATSGRDWAGLLRNEDYIVTGVRTVPLLPGVLVLLLVIGGIIMAWRREAG